MIDSGELLNEYVINSKLFADIGYVIKKQYEDNHKFLNLIRKNKKHDNKIISYDDFEHLIRKLILNIMKFYLLSIGYENDNYSCFIKKIGALSGHFYPSKNEIVINRCIIDRLYQGDISAFLTIFHELNHFKIRYDIKLGKTDENITRILKENLLSKCILDYYDTNYDFISEEVYVDILACLNLLNVIDILKIKVTKNDINNIKRKIGYCKEKYNYYKRKVAFLNTNCDKVDFRDLFNIFILEHPEWMLFPQIASDYVKKSLYF